MLWALALVVLAAADQRPTHVTFASPGGCPERAVFENELSARTNRVRITESSAEATAWITVDIVARGKRFDGTLEVRTETGVTRRKLTSPKCETVTAALSLAAALVLDPEGAKTGPLSEPAPEPVVEAPPVVEPVPSPVIVEPPPPEVTAVAPPPPAPPKEEPPVAATLSVLALGLVSTGVSGSPDFGGGLGLELALAPKATALRAVSRLGVSALSGRTVTGASGAAAYPLHVVGELDVAAGLDLGPVRPELGAALQLAPVQIGGVGADEVFTTLRWLVAVGPEARVAVRFSGWQVALHGGLFANLLRERYVVDPEGTVFAVPDWYFAGGLQVGRSIP